ncbi:MAG: hypothetical protein ACOX6V_01510 [Patescibacteria group bacterium]
MLSLQERVSQNSFLIPSNRQQSHELSRLAPIYRHLHSEKTLSEPTDLALTPELRASFNETRLQFNDQQEIPQNPEEITPEFVRGLRAQIGTQLAEHALAQPVICHSEIGLEEDGIHFPGQKTDRPFLNEMLTSNHNLSIFEKLEPYWLIRFGYVPSREDLITLAQDPDLFRHLVSDEVFYKTKLGLEFAEVVGFIRLEKRLTEATGDEIVVELSPGSQEYRPTEIIHNWIRIYKTRKIEGGKTVFDVLYVKTFHTKDEIDRIMECWTGQDMSRVAVQDYVSNPLLFQTNPETFLKSFSVHIEPEFVATYEQALADPEIVAGIATLAAQISTRSCSVQEINQYRTALEKRVVEIHKNLVERYVHSLDSALPIHFVQQIRQYQEMYGRGGGCGTLDTAVRGMLGTREAGDPNLPDTWVCENCGTVHHIDNNKPSTYFHRCVNCGKSGVC